MSQKIKINLFIYHKKMNIRITSIIAALLLSSSISGFAQDYDDDIYFNPSKAKTKEKKQVKKTNKTIVYDIPAADTYTPALDTNSNVDIDKYNRRGVFAKGDTSVVNQKNIYSFTNTQKIERFHNPDVIINSEDPEVATLYYSQPATNVNIYINNDPFAYNYWGFPYSSWYWGYPRSWYAWNWNWGWDPYWSWNWGWGPSWSWNWGWGPSWSWGPAWRPGWGWGPTWGWTAPVRPNRPIGNVRPGYGSRPTGHYRPGNNGIRPNNRPAYGINSNNSYRPGNSSSGYRTGNRQSIRTGNNQNRNSYNNYNNNNSYRPSYNNSTRSQGSFGSGSTGGFRGGSSGSVRGGGGGRGRH